MRYSILPNCDKCGRFMVPGLPGTSWLHVPDTEVNTGEDADRCVKCTAKHGPLRPAGVYVLLLVCGTIPEECL